MYIELLLRHKEYTVVRKFIIFFIFIDAVFVI